MKIIVVGAGVGGLTVALRLAVAGADVTVIERNATVGGKVARLENAGYRFDLGPTLLTLPDRYDDVFRLAGTSLADEVELVRLDHPFRYRWSDGSQLDVADDPTEFAATLEAFSPGSAVQWSRFLERSAQTWEIAEQAFLTSAKVSPWSLAKRVRNPLDLRRVDGTRTLAKAASDAFDDPRLAQMVGRYATYSGSSPYLAPATLACIAHVERSFGCWHVMGGFTELTAALERVARRVGVQIRTGTDVGRITADGKRVTGVELADGGVETADVVVSNVDADHLYRDLLPQPKSLRKLELVKRSMSAFLLCAGVRGRTEDIAHHNVWFSLDDEREFRQLSAGQVAIDPTIYACVSSVADQAQAPRDCENWYILVNVPGATGLDRKLMTAGILNRLAERGVDLRSRIEFTRTLVPADFDARYRARGGAIYGSSSDGKRAAFQRPANVGPVDGLYLVGGSAHPGGGLPLVAMGAEIVADLIAARHG